MPTLEHLIAEKLEAYKLHADPDILSEVTDLLETLLPEAVESNEAKKNFRSEKLMLELELLHQIDIHLQPNFDPKDAPLLNVSPPLEAGLPSGADPSNITDPRIRAEYEHKISVNREKARKYELQMKLHRLNQRATTQTEVHIRNTYSASPEDLAELDNLLDKAQLIMSRKVSLRQFSRTLQKP